MHKTISFILLVLGMSSYCLAAGNENTVFEISILSGNNQVSRKGRPFEKSLEVEVTENSKPVAGIKVNFYHTNADKEKYLTLNKSSAITDSLGKASVKIETAGGPGSYEIQVSCPESMTCRPAFFNVTVRRGDWIILLIVGLSGGLAFFLFGMSLMSEGMQNSAGNRMRNILSKLTHNRFAGISIGAVITVIIQSSSATNVLLVSFVNSKLLSFRKTFPVMLGAAIGTTITVQIIAFRLTDYALLFVAAGIALEYFRDRRRIKGIGKAILGFGLLFYGMHIMSESMVPLRTYEPFLQILFKMENPAFGIAAGAIFTAIIQSSSAFIGILIIFSTQGLLSLDAAISLIIGANLGTSITAIISSLNCSREAKQVAYAHTLYKIAGAVIFVFFIPLLAKIVVSLTGDAMTASGNQIATPREIAHTHTIYNIILCSLFLPLTGIFPRFIEYIYPVKETEEQPFILRYLDNNLLRTPVPAINVARREISRMIKKIYFMTEKIIHPFIERNEKILEEIDVAEKEIDFLRDEITKYLVKVSQSDPSPDVTQDIFMMLNTVREFEEIADIVSQQLLEKARYWCMNKYKFSEEGKKDIVRYHQHTLNIIIESLKVIGDPNLQAAKRLRSLYNKYRNEFFELEKQHYNRLQANDESSISSSKTHLEIITLLRVISSHAMNTSRMLISHQEKNKMKNASGKPAN